MDKIEVRKKLLEKRSSIPNLEHQRKSFKIIKNLIPLLKDYNNIALYVDFNNEVETRLYLNYFIKYFKIVSIPKVVGDDLIFYQLRNTSELTLGTFNILEPTSNIEISKADIEVIIIPLVGYDSKLNRIGYGKGYYDRYLKDFKGLKIGIAFETQKCLDIPINKHDISLDLIVSEQNILKNSK